MESQETESLLMREDSSGWVKGASQQGWVWGETLFLALLGAKESLRDRLGYTVLLSSLGVYPVPQARFGHQSSASQIKGQMDSEK